MSDSPTTQRLGSAQVEPSPAARLEDVLRAIGVHVLPDGTPVHASHDRDTLEFAIATLKEHVEIGLIRDDEIVTVQSYIASLEGNLHLMQSSPPAPLEGVPDLELPSAAEVGSLIDALDSSFNPSSSATAGITPPKPGKTQGETPMATKKTEKAPKPRTSKSRTKKPATEQPASEATPPEVAAAVVPPPAPVLAVAPPVESPSAIDEDDEDEDEDEDDEDDEDGDPRASAPVVPATPVAAVRSLLPKGMDSLISRRGPTTPLVTTRDETSISTAGKAAAQHIMRRAPEAQAPDIADVIADAQAAADAENARSAEETSRLAAALAAETERMRAEEEERELARALGEAEELKQVAEAKASAEAESEVRRSLAPTDLLPSPASIPSVEINLETLDPADVLPVDSAETRTRTPAGGYPVEERVRRVAAAGGFSEPPARGTTPTVTKDAPAPTPAKAASKRTTYANLIGGTVVVVMLVLGFWSRSGDRDPRPLKPAQETGYGLTCQTVTAENLKAYLGQKDPTEFVNVGGTPAPGEAYLDATGITAKPSGTRTVYDVTGAKVCWQISGFAFNKDNYVCEIVTAENLKAHLGQKDPTEFVNVGGKPAPGEAYLDATGITAKPSGTRTVYDVTGAKLCHY